MKDGIQSVAEKRRKLSDAIVNLEIEKSSVRNLIYASVNAFRQGNGMSYTDLEDLLDEIFIFGDD